MLRIGHRPKRDVRVTTHVALVARAFGCSGFFLEGDDGYLNSIRGILRKWGGVGDFELETVKSPRSLVKSWRRDGGVVIHLTMYGVNIIGKESAIREIDRPILIVVGAGKVSRWYYENADYNIAIGNQPHSEVAALAILLDRIYMGRELGIDFGDARIRILGTERGKRVLRA